MHTYEGIFFQISDRVGALPVNLSAPPLLVIVILYTSIGLHLDVWESDQKLKDFIGILCVLLCEPNVRCMLEPYPIREV